jgi:hypothetical protein
MTYRPSYPAIAPNPAGHAAQTVKSSYAAITSIFLPESLGLTHKLTAHVFDSKVDGTVSSKQLAQQFEAPTKQFRPEFSRDYYAATLPNYLKSLPLRKDDFKKDISSKIHWIVYDDTDLNNLCLRPEFEKAHQAIIKQKSGNSCLFKACSNPNELMSDHLKEALDVLKKRCGFDSLGELNDDQKLALIEVLQVMILQSKHKFNTVAEAAETSFAAVMNDLCKHMVFRTEYSFVTLRLDAATIKQAIGTNDSAAGGGRLPRAKKLTRLNGDKPAQFTLRAKVLGNQTAFQAFVELPPDLKGLVGDAKVLSKLIGATVSAIPFYGSQTLSWRDDSF